MGSGHHEVLWVLIEQRARLDATDTQGCSPLHLSAAAGHQRCVEALLLAMEPIDIELLDHTGHSALELAQAAGHTELAASILGVSDERQRRLADQLEEELERAEVAAEL